VSRSTISASLRRALEEPRSNTYVVVLLEITHPQLGKPIRVANDVVDYVFEDNTYIGFPFDIEIVGDVTTTPRGQLSIQNVDQRISDAILSLTTPPRLRILLFSSDDFGEVGEPSIFADSEEVFADDEETTVDAGDTRNRTISDGAVPEYEASHLVFGNISVDVMRISGEIVSFDMSNEPWPAIRSTADRLPGLQP
jgi:hypothetical protein